MLDPRQRKTRRATAARPLPKRRLLACPQMDTRTARLRTSLLRYEAIDPMNRTSRSESRTSWRGVTPSLSFERMIQCGPRRPRVVQSLAVAPSSLPDTTDGARSKAAGLRIAIDEASAECPPCAESPFRSKHSARELRKDRSTIILCYCSSVTISTFTSPTCKTFDIAVRIVLPLWAFTVAMTRSRSCSSSGEACALIPSTTSRI